MLCHNFQFYQILIDILFFFQDNFELLYLNLYDNYYYNNSDYYKYLSYYVLDCIFVEISLLEMMIDYKWKNQNFFENEKSQ